MSNATIKFASLEEAIILAKALYGIVITDQDLMDYAGPFGRRAGGFLKMDGFLFGAKPDEHGYLQLPCKADKILEVSIARHVRQELATESVLFYTRETKEDDQYLVGSPMSEANNRFVQQNLELYSEFQTTWLTPAQLVNYETVGSGTIQVMPKHVTVDVKYEYEVLDKKGFPLVTDKQVEAMAAFANMCEVQKLFYQKKADQAQLREAKQESGLLCDVARGGDGINANGMDEVMNAFTSFHRHRYHVR